MKKTYRDPVTGDALSFGEHISWMIQNTIRRWTFLILLTVVTILVWSTNNPTALTWWNLCASYLAIVIESIVGIAMFSATKRDAVCLREVRAISERVEQLAQVLLRDVVDIEEQLHIEAAPDKGQPGNPPAEPS
jgi:hypothetical protein